MKLLVLMAGPYGRGLTVRFRLYDRTGGEVFASGRVERIGEEAELHYEETRKVDAPDCAEGVRVVLRALLERGAVHELTEIAAVVHPVAHGGERFRSTRVIDEQVLEGIRDCIPLAPLHNPHNLAGIETAALELPNAAQVAVFSTAFHVTMPDHAYLYGIPYELYVEYGIRRYGSQGISHRYAAARTAELLGRRPEELRLITCYLGSGSSVTAVRGGRSIDTSMGFTPLEGLLMSTRAGDMDPAIIPYVMAREGMGPDQVLDLLIRRSGLAGVSGISGDLDELMAAARDGSYRADLALRMYCYRLRKYVSAYYGVLGGVDGVTFTADVGEGYPEIRARALEGLECLGLELDPERNREIVGREGIISKRGSRVAVVVTPCDHERLLAMEAASLLKERAIEELL